MTTVDVTGVVSRLQALSTEVSALGPALAQAAPTGEFAAVLAGANAALQAAVDPTPAVPATAASSSSSALLGLGEAAGADPSSAATGVTGTAVVSDAEQYLGVPYVWGGTSPVSGFDCSGFVQHVYGDLGISLPRTSQEQSTVGTPVADLADAQPGDLVFFEPGSSGPGHVGIYLGNGQMIDAPHTGTDVRIEPVGQPVAIRRILTGADATETAVDSGPLPAGIPASLGVPSSLVPLIDAAAAHAGVPASLLAAVAKQESGFNPAAVSSAGAEGLMQLMPSTAAGLGVDAFDPSQALSGAAQLLSGYLTDYGGSVPMALAAYNAGPGAVARYGGVPPYPETTAYVSNILGMLGAAS